MRGSVRARQLDVRSLPPWHRHRKILAAFDGTPPGECITVVTDHEPVNLRAEFDLSRAGLFAWTQRHIGEGRWDVVIRRVTMSDGADSPATLLSKCGVFAEGSQETRLAAAGAASERHFASGDVIYEQDVHWPYLGVVAEGAVLTIVGSESGREQTLFTSSAAETFAEAATLDGGRTIGRAVADGSVRVLLIPSGIVLSLMGHDAGFARALAAQSAQRTRALAIRLSEHISQPTIARVALAILPYASPNVGLSPTLASLRRMTQSQLAIAAGTVKEVVARSIAQLEAAGALQREAGRIARADRQKLLAFTGMVDANASRADRTQRKNNGLRHPQRPSTPSIPPARPW